MSILLILAPADPAAPLRCMRLDPGGAIVERWLADGSQALPAAFRHGVTRTLLAVPGTDVRTLWLALPTRQPLQALAVARQLLEDQASGLQDAQHVAIAAGDVSQPRLVAVAARQAIGDWLQRCAAIGVVPDVMLPDHLLLPAPAGPDQLHIAADAERWLVRGTTLAFSAEASLARQVLAPRDVHVEPDPAHLERLLAQGAAAEPALNLLQYEFAPVAAPVAGPGKRRLALLALAVLLSPAVLVAAQALGYQFAARGLDRQAAGIASRSAAAGGTGADADPTVQGQPWTPASHARARRALFDAVSRHPGTRLQGLEYSADAGLTADLVHATADQLQAMAQALRQAGLLLEAGSSVGQGSELRTTIRLEQPS